MKGYRQPRVEQQVALQPVARPVDTYVPAVATPDNRAAELAKALSGLNPTLLQFGENQVRRDAAEHEALAAQKLEGMTLDEASAAVKEGSISEFSNPWFQAAFMKQYGMRLAQSRVNETRTKMESGEIDPISANVEQYATDIFNADQQTVSANKFMAAGYQQVFSKLRPSMLEIQSDARGKEIKKTNLESTYLLLESGAYEMMGKGASPEDVAKYIHGQYADRKKMLNISYREMDEMVWTLAGKLANEGHTAHVRGILETDRTDPESGQKIPALSSKKEYRAQFDELLEKSLSENLAQQRKSLSSEIADWRRKASKGQLDGKSLDAWRQKNPGVIDDNAAVTLETLNANAADRLQRKVDALALKTEKMDANRKALGTTITALLTGKANSVRDEEVVFSDGSTKTFTRDSKVQDGLDAIFNEIDANPDIKPEVKTSAKLGILAGGNGVVYEPFKNQMEASYAKLQTAAASSGKAPESFWQDFALWKQMKDTNPGLASLHTSAKANTMFTLIDNAKAIGLNDAQALDPVMAALSDPEFDRKRSQYLSQNKYEREVKNAINAVVPWYRSSKSVQNGSEVANRVEEMTADLVAVYKMSPEAAAKRAAETVAARTVLYNGLTFDASRINLDHTKLPSYIDAKLDTVLEAVPKATLEAYERNGTPLKRENLSVFLAADGRTMRVVDKNTLIPVHIPGKGTLTFPWQSLKDSYDERQRELANRKLKN